MSSIEHSTYSKYIMLLRHTQYTQYTLVFVR